MSIAATCIEVLGDGMIGRALNANVFTFVKRQS